MEAIIREGISHTDPSSLGSTTIYSIQGDAVMALIEGVGCRLGSHHWLNGNFLGIYSRSGQYWPVNNVRGARVKETREGWLVLTDLTWSSGTADYAHNLLSVTLANEEWTIKIIDSFRFPYYVSDFGVNGNYLTVYAYIQTVPPPCEFTPTLGIVSNFVGVHIIRTYDESDTGAYIPRTETITSVSMYVQTESQPEKTLITIENWQAYCVE